MECRDEILKALGGQEVIFFEVTNPERIGHMGGEVDLWLKERHMSCAKSRTVLVMSADQCANPHLFLYLSEKFDATISRKSWRLLTEWLPELTSRHVIRHDYFVAIGHAAACYDVQARWGGREPLFILREDDRLHLQQACEAWGISPGDWFVCFHNREAGYAPDDDDHHLYRNANIESCLPAMLEVVDRGGWAIRMGDPTMKPLPQMARVIDYAHSSWRTPLLDVALSASARCFIGSSSGLYIIASMFGVRAGNANMAPIGMHAMTARDIAMPKLYFSEREGRLLRFEEVFDSPSAGYRFSDEFTRDGLRVVDNDADDILAMLRELLDGTVSGGSRQRHVDELLQQRYRSLFKPQHYGFGAASMISPAFLRKHADLL